MPPTNPPPPTGGRNTFLQEPDNIAAAAGNVVMSEQRTAGWAQRDLCGRILRAPAHQGIQACAALGRLLEYQEQ